MKLKSVIPMLACLLLVSASVFCQRSSSTESFSQPGVVDLTTVTALHPLMSLYDFSRAGFINVEFGLDAKSLHEKRQKLINLEPADKKQLEADLEELNRAYANLKQKQFSLLNEIKQQRNEIKQRESSILADKLNQQINELWQKLNLTRFRLSNPDLMLPEVSQAMLKRIEEEVQKAVELVAEKKGIDLVLNASLPNHGKRNMQRSFEILTDKNLTLAETDLYYAFLANSKETQAQSQDREHREEGMSLRQDGAARWLEQSRQPAVQEQLPINPHPLVLKGGINITVEVVVQLLKQYNCADQVVEKLTAMLQKKYQ
jgi:Skp family chaperone for outer membrane proteins